jgi:hypothetical protein
MTHALHQIERNCDGYQDATDKRVRGRVADQYQSQSNECFRVQF